MMYASATAIMILSRCVISVSARSWCIIFSHRVHMKLAHWYHALSKVCTDCDDTVPLTPSLRRPFKHAIFFRPPVGQRVNTHSVFWEFCRKPCQHATRGCDKRWMTCIHAGVSRSPREHASVPPDKRHCRQWMSSLFCGFLPNPFIHDLFCWSSRHKFVKTVL